MSTIGIYQTGHSNEYLLDCKKAVEPMHLPMLDLILATLVTRNRRSRTDITKMKTEGKTPVWNREFHLNLPALATLIYPKGQSAKPARDRRAWIKAAIQSCHAILDSECLIEVFAEEDSFVRIRDDVAQWAMDTTLPSPVWVPVELYRYRRLAGNALAEHAFIANRRLLVDKKMNPKKWQSARILDFNLLHSITGIPLPEEWRLGPSHNRVDGPSLWKSDCLKRNIEFYELFKVAVHGSKIVITQQGT